MNRKAHLVSTILIMVVLVAAATPMLAQGPDTPAQPRAPRPSELASSPQQPQAGDFGLAPSGIEWGGNWVDAADAPFAFTRFDAGYFPKDIKVYFMGGRLSSLITPDTDGSVWSVDSLGNFVDSGVDLVTPISNYTMNLLEDASGWGFYTFCGRPTGGGVINAVQVYYPDTNTAVQLPAQDNYPGSGTCTSALNVVYNNKVYVAGGFDPAAPPYNWSETWVFDPLAPSGSRWTQIPTANLSIPRAYIMGAVVDNKIYAIGGNWFNGSSLINISTVEVLDLSSPTPSWDDVSAADMPEGCSEGRAWGFDTYNQFRDADRTAFAGKIVSTCGGWSDENDRVYAYDTRRNSWSTFPSLNNDRRDQAATFIPVAKFGFGLMMMWEGRQDSDDNVLTTPEGYYLYAGPCDVLLVDDDWDFDSTVGENDGARGYYESVINQLGFAYGVWDTASTGTPPAAALAGYDITVWFTGYDWQVPISPTEEAELTTYLDGGGNLVMSSMEQNYAYPGSTIMTNYFWVDTVIDDVVITDTVGNALDPLFAGLGPYTLVRPDDVIAYWPVDTYEGPYDDVVTSRPGGYEPLIYGSTGQPNSTRYDSGTFKTVYMGFPFEWVDTIQQRAEILGPALRWMCPIREPIYLPLVLRE